MFPRRSWTSKHHSRTHKVSEKNQIQISANCCWFFFFLLPSALSFRAGVHFVLWEAFEPNNPSSLSTKIMKFYRLNTENFQLLWILQHPLACKGMYPAQRRSMGWRGQGARSGRRTSSANQAAWCFVSPLQLGQCSVLYEPNWGCP